MLVPAAIDAVKQWRYKPYFLKGEPVAVETMITANFALAGGNPELASAPSATRGHCGSDVTVAYAKKTGGVEIMRYAGGAWKGPFAVGGSRSLGMGIGVSWKATSPRSLRPTEMLIGLPDSAALRAAAASASIGNVPCSGPMATGPRWAS